ncbi:hypothetical protein F4803DRAFT_423438 [Xylaria telfairii]|nr:hypothetical protein F4803DRAFT_423438 [Xylaria telfairii]
MGHGAIWLRLFVFVFFRGYAYLILAGKQTTYFPSIHTYTKYMYVYSNTPTHTYTYTYERAGGRALVRVYLHNSIILFFVCQNEILPERKNLLVRRCPLSTYLAMRRLPKLCNQLRLLACLLGDLCRESYPMHYMLHVEAFFFSFHSPRPHHIDCVTGLFSLFGQYVDHLFGFRGYAGSFRCRRCLRVVGQGCFPRVPRSA